MKNGQLIKSTPVLSEEQELELINTYSRRTLTADEVYIFSVVLCDNDVDRDFERFTVESLFELEKLFVGKTGILDHDPTAKNQKARIISCKVESVDGEMTTLGDQLFRLTARAYIPRTEGNRELIEAIEAGLVKEVSVGCSVARTVCSVCRNDLRSPMCSHIKGHSYDGEVCCGELSEPTDAYEFSFVAVPAQRSAGVIKSGSKEKEMKDIIKGLSGGSDITLSKGEAEQLRTYIAKLESENTYAEAYKNELDSKLREAVRAKGVQLDYVLEECILKKLSIEEAQALLKALTKEKRVLKPQLCAGTDNSEIGNTEFRI